MTEKSQEISEPSPELIDFLISRANENEIPEFCNEDPSQFLRWYKLGTTGTDLENFTGANHAGTDLDCKSEKLHIGTDLVEVECASFIAAMLSFGSRKQFIPKIKQILTLADKTGGISKWLKEKKYSEDFPCGEKKFYRFYSHDDMQTFFTEISTVLNEYASLGNAAKTVMKSKECRLYEVFADLFPKSKIVPKGKNSANKRIHMFLRWMVRKNSPVDIGLWDWYSPENLFMPLDVHVMQESIKLGLLPENASATLKTAKLLTEKMKQAFPEDPTRGDFALFGMGVNQN